MQTADRVVLKDGSTELRFGFEPHWKTPTKEVVRVDVFMNGELVAAPTFDLNVLGELVGFVGGRWML